MTCKIGILWDDEVEWDRDKPFSKKSPNNTYATFTEIAEERGAEVYIAGYKWYNDNILEKAYYFNGSKWQTVKDVEIDVVFDKFKFDRETSELKRSMNKDLPVLNRFELEELCKDKLLSYEKFPERVPETQEATEQSVKNMLEKYGRVILKPRYDFGGRGIEVIDSMDGFNEEPNQLVQRFIDSSHGIKPLEVDGIHDLRVLVVNGEPTGAYIREPNGDDLIANVSLGGSMYFVDLEDVPEEAMQIVEEVRQKFDRFNPAFYSVDLIFDGDGKPWILEFNSKPGLNFYDDDEIEKHKRPIVEKIVEMLVEMC